MTCRKLAAWESLSCKVKSLVIRNVKHVVIVPVDILGLWLIRVKSPLIVDREFVLMTSPLKFMYYHEIIPRSYHWKLLFSLVRTLVDRSSRHEMRDPLLCKKRVMDVRHRGANAHGDGGFRHDDESRSN